MVVSILKKPKWLLDFKKTDAIIINIQMLVLFIIIDQLIRIIRVIYHKISFMSTVAIYCYNVARLGLGVALR